jgi:hypothetical protein
MANEACARFVVGVGAARPRPTMTWSATPYRGDVPTSLPSWHFQVTPSHPTADTVPAVRRVSQ